METEDKTTIPKSVLFNRNLSSWIFFFGRGAGEAWGVLFVLLSNSKMYKYKGCRLEKNCYYVHTYIQKSIRIQPRFQCFSQLETTEN